MTSSGGGPPIGVAGLAVAIVLGMGIVVTLGLRRGSPRPVPASGAGAQPVDLRAIGPTSDDPLVALLRAADRPADPGSRPPPWVERLDRTAAGRVLPLPGHPDGRRVDLPPEDEAGRREG